MDFIKPNNEETTSSIEIKVGATDWKWVDVNPSKERYDELFNMKGFGIGETYPEYFKQDKNGDKFLRIQIFLETLEEENPTRSSIDFFLYNSPDTAKSGRVRFIDGLRGKTYVEVSSDGTPDLSTAQYVDHSTLTPLYKGEADLLDFLLVITGASSVNSKLIRDYEAAMREYEISKNSDKEVEAPEKPELITIDRLRPSAEHWDTLFNSNDAEEVERAYNQVIGFYKAVCKKVNSFANPSAVKAVRGLKLVGTNVYGTIYTKKFGYPGEKTQKYDPAATILKQIKKDIDYLNSIGGDVPYYNIEEGLEWKAWNKDKGVFGKKTNNSNMVPGNKPGMPKFPGGFGAVNPNKPK